MHQPELFIDIDDKSSDNPISGSIIELINSGLSSVRLGIRHSADKREKNIELNLVQFKKIKEVQDLPDWVIIKFILSSGMLKECNFSERLLND